MFRIANNILLAAIILINGYILLLPVLPAAQLQWQNRSPEKRQALAQQVHTPTKQPEQNKLIIPSILLDQPIFEGSDPATLNQGLWLRPNTSTPAKGSNTVIAGHRFSYTTPGIFYSLDKVGLGDEIALFWQGKTYLYKTSTINTVSATAVGVEAPTKEPLLTLYTCTPFWSFKDRLVITAILETVYE